MEELKTRGGEQAAENERLRNEVNSKSSSFLLLLFVVIVTVPKTSHIFNSWRAQTEWQRKKREKQRR